MMNKTLVDYPDLMRPEHMASALGWHVVYIRHLCHEGVIPGAFKIGRRWYCSKTDFFEWVMNHD